MWNKIKEFFIRICPSKRKIIQLYAALLHNAYMMGFVTGEIFKGDSKILCAPGLNCYSCPGAVAACPLGTIQNALYNSKTKTPTYVLGIILLYCIIFGRTICGWLCPLGLVQELLYKIKTPKLMKNKITRVLSYFKYVLLLVLVIGVPLAFSKDLAVPGFCKYVCPAGTLGGALSLLIHPENEQYFSYLGPIFTWKFIILVIFIIASIFIYRFFCRFLCPLGAIYGIFNKLSILGVKVDKSKCDNCGECVRTCKMDVKEVGDHECIMCGECKDVCHVNAIHWKTIGKLVEKELLAEGYEANSDMSTLAIKPNEIALKSATTEAEPVEADTVEKVENEASINDVEEYQKMPKRKFHITALHQRIFKITMYILMAASLIFTFVYANFLVKTTLGINDSARDISINLYESDEFFHLRTDDSAVLLYFYDEYNEEELLSLESMFSSDEETQEATKLVLVSSYSNKDKNYNLVSSLVTKDNVVLGYDQDNRIIKEFLFKDDIKYPYSVFLDFNDKVVLKKDGAIKGKDYNSTILPIVSGDTIGNKVGDVCINADINIIGSDEIFNIADNRGKITIINFWYTECVPCVHELPFFNEIQEKYKDQVEIIAIHDGEIYNDEEKVVKQFIKDNFDGFSIKFAHDDKKSTYYQSLGGKGTYPMSVFVGKDGKIKYNESTAYKSVSEIEEKILELLK